MTLCLTHAFGTQKLSVPWFVLLTPLALMVLLDGSRVRLKAATAKLKKRLNVTRAAENVQIERKQPQKEQNAHIQKNLVYGFCALGG